MFFRSALTFSRIARSYSECRLLFRPAVTMLFLLVVQISLGALTVWTTKAVIPTTAHVVTGALVKAIPLNSKRHPSLDARVPPCKCR